MKITKLAATLAGASVLLIVQPVFAQTEGAFTGPDESFEEPWSDGPILAPAPLQPEAAEPGSMYVPPAPEGLIEPFDHPPISPNSPTLIPPDSMSIPAGGFHPEGPFLGPASGFRGPIR